MRWDIKQIRSRSLGSAAKLLNTLLIVAVSYTCANVVLDWMNGQGSGEKLISRKGIEKPGEKTVSPANASRQDTLVNLNLFGGNVGILPAMAGVGAETGSQGLPETRLEIQLLGIFFSGDSGSGGRALIKTGPEEEKSYRTGERIGDGPKIREILFDHVVIERDGHLEILRLPRSLLTASQLGPRKKNQPQVVQNQGGSSAKLLRILRDQLRLSPESVLEMVRIDPFFNGGTFEGFKLSPGKNPEFLKQFGLESGDIIVEVNEVRMTDPLKGMEAMAQLASANAIFLRVKRGTDIIPYEFSLDQ
ncbi:MAG: hypothetical protein HQL64_08390 [Magnetococcales bacterium]|nr:hypothetical protein [Magnetococcales bacterium]